MTSRDRGTFWIAWIACFILIAGCTTVPETGRRQFILLSESEEMQLGLTSFNEMKKTTPISKDAAGNAMLQEVGRRISAVAASDMPNAQWEFVLFENEQPNAFCLPGGKVGVYTGILPITRDAEGLATVIGHEVAHASARHGGERISQQMGMNAFAALLGATLSSSDPEVQSAAQMIYGLGANLGLALPHNRAQESEADYIGLLYMARAGYNPEAALGFWQRFAEVTSAGGEPPWFLSTHPLNQARIDQIREWLPGVKAEYRPAP